MNFSFIIILIHFTLFVSGWSFASDTSSLTTRTNVILKVDVADKEIKPKISFRLKEIGVPGSEFRKYTFDNNKSNNVVLSVSLVKKIALLQIESNNAAYLFPFFFYTEPNDAVTLIQSGASDIKTINFQGQGAIKYNCRMQMYICEKQIIDSINKIPELTSYTDIPSFHNLSIGLQRRRIIMEQCIKKLDTYKPALSKEVYDMMYCDLRSNYGQKVISEIKYFYLDGNGQDKLLAKDIFNAFITQQLSEVQNFETKVINYNYLNLIIEGVKAKMLFDGLGRSVVTIYDYIKSNYFGTMKEYLILQLLTDPSVKFQNGEMSLIDKDLTNSLNDKEILSSVKLWFDRIGPGADLKYFDFINEKGKKVSLDDYKGKQILLDFWFTGCTACRVLNDSMKKEGADSLNRSDLVYLSISADEDKEKFSASVKGGKYTLPISVNLYAGKPGFDHPFFQFYHVDGFPRLMLIDSLGKIVTTNMEEKISSILKTINLE